MVQDSGCHARRKDGSPCRAIVTLSSSYCAMHDPSRQAEVQAARARGGRGKSRIARAEKLVPASLRPTIATLFTALDEVHRGALEPKQAQAMAALAGAIARLYTTGVLEERIAVLEVANGGRADRVCRRPGPAPAACDATPAHPF